MTAGCVLVDGVHEGPANGIQFGGRRHACLSDIVGVAQAALILIGEVVDAGGEALPARVANQRMVMRLPQRQASATNFSTFGVLSARLMPGQRCGWRDRKSVV